MKKLNSVNKEGLLALVLISLLVISTIGIALINKQVAFAQGDISNTTNEPTMNVNVEKVQVKIQYIFEDGTVYKEYTKDFDKGHLIDASDLEMLPDDMKFIDDFLFYEVTGTNDIIIRKVDYLKKDASTQTPDEPSKPVPRNEPVEVRVVYMFENGEIYKEYLKVFNKGSIIRAFQLEALPKDMKFADEFSEYEVKGKDDVIVRKVIRSENDSPTQQTKEKVTVRIIYMFESGELYKEYTKQFDKGYVMKFYDFQKLEKDLEFIDGFSNYQVTGEDDVLIRIIGYKPKTKDEKTSTDENRLKENAKKLEEEIEKLKKELSGKNELSESQKSKISELEKKLNAWNKTFEIMSSVDSMSKTEEKDDEMNKLSRQIKNIQDEMSKLKNSQATTYLRPQYNGQISTSTTNTPIIKNPNGVTVPERKEEPVTRYPNKLTPKNPNGDQSQNSNEKSVNTNKGIATPPSKARASVTENVDNGNGNYPIHHTGDNNQTDIYSADARQFITFSTKNGKEFHLIVNHDEESQNVLLLTEVSEDDLLNMVETKTEPVKEVVKEEPVVKEEIPPVKEEKKSDIGTYLVMLLAIGGALGAGYYFKVMKKKENEELASLEEDDRYISEAEETYEENEDEDVEKRDIDEVEEDTKDLL